MNNQNGFTSLSVLLMITLGVAVVGGGVYYLMQDQNSQTLPLEETTYTPPVTTQATNNTTQTPSTQQLEPEKTATSRSTTPAPAPKNQSVTTVFTVPGVVTIDQQTLTQKVVLQDGCQTKTGKPCGPITLTGTSYGTYSAGAPKDQNNIVIVIVPAPYTGPSDYGNVPAAAYNAGYIGQVVQGDVMTNTWTHTISRVAVGTYVVFVYPRSSGMDTLPLAQETLTVQ